MRLAYPFHKHHTQLLWTLTGLWIATGITSLLLWIFGPPYIPLWMSVVEPAEQLAPKVAIFIIPIVASFLFFLTLFFARKSALEHEEYLATLSLWSGIILHGLFLLSVLRIMKVLL
jgi:hypothetical protein